VIARLFVGTPFLMVLPDNTTFTVFTYEDDGYEVTVYPPARSDRPLRVDVPDKIEIDDKPRFIADSLRIDFKKNTFARETNSKIDPPEEVIRRAIASFLARFRYVARGFQISPIEFPQTDWRLQYLDDDGKELQETKGLIRARAALGRSFSLVALTPEIWGHVHDLPPDWVAPRWHDLLLDATGALPRVGTAIVLAATALEVFIADVLDSLAKHAQVSQSLWDWLNHRGNWLKDPSTEEQFDFLLSHFTAHSLKENQALWMAFKNLRTARNTFVHEGAPIVGGTQVTLAEAGQLIARAREIVDWVRQWLPADLQWPHVELKTQMRMEMKLL